MVLGAIALCVCAACPSDDDAGAGVQGSGGRARYVVTLDVPPVDLAEYRALPADEIDAYVQRKRQETASAQANLDIVVKSLGGQVVARWWMTGQATIEISPTGEATIRSTTGVKSVVPDTPLQ